MTKTYDPAALRRDKIRAAVRVTAENLQQGDVVQPWNDRTTPERTVDWARNDRGLVLVRWADGSGSHFRQWTVFHRSNVKL